jgi:sortase (surface protein transpeptidase)
VAPAPGSKSLPRSAPTAIAIPAIAVHTTGIVALGRRPDGTLGVPVDPGRAGWYAPGPSPGELGPAVIVAHVDSRTGPALFWRLGELRRGQQIDITRADGAVVMFVVDDVERYPKDAFPTVRVYGATAEAELRLITCGGTFEHRTGHYRDNTVVFAHLAGLRRRRQDGATPNLP